MITYDYKKHMFSLIFKNHGQTSSIQLFHFSVENISSEILYSELLQSCKFTHFFLEK